MTPSFSFFSLFSGLLNEANIGLEQALELSKDQSSQFVIPKIEMDIKCFVLKEDGLKIVSSNAEALNYYGNNGESTVKLTFKLKQSEK
jgi:hypothetical protein